MGAWVKVFRVSLHCWNYETLNRVADIWGSLVSVGSNLTKVHKFEKMELLISLTQTEMLDEIIRIEVRENHYPIRVRENRLSEVE